jgi:hypothetical protein
MSRGGQPVIPMNRVRPLINVPTIEQAKMLRRIGSRGLDCLLIIDSISGNFSIDSK